MAPALLYRGMREFTRFTRPVSPFDNERFTRLDTPGQNTQYSLIHRKGEDQYAATLSIPNELLSGPYGETVAKAVVEALRCRLILTLDVFQGANE